ncbi:hypothetical protein BaRGS_00019715 [Batillaria attramentaria]|uniref:Uncharacterized protein n=1 Tax=Batillaria attramentaria TaxID=370345 RepID=A0ABD0KPS4_9CAEN
MKQEVVLVPDDWRRRVWCTWVSVRLYPPPSPFASIGVQVPVVTRQAPGGFDGDMYGRVCRFRHGRPVSFDLVAPSTCPSLPGVVIMSREAVVSMPKSNAQSVAVGVKGSAFQASENNMAAGFKGQHQPSQIASCTQLVLHK